MRPITTKNLFPLIAVLAVAILSIDGVAAQPAPSAFTLRHGVIVDSTRAAAYVAKPGGSIEAVDLASGRTLWTSSAAVVPLGADESHLIAQVEEKPQPTDQFRIVILDAAGGGKVGEAAITLPAGVRALAADELGTTFRATAEREGTLFLISWYYQQMVVRRDGLEKVGTTRGFAGSARLNPQTGKVLSANGGPVTDVPAPFRTYGAPPQQPWRAGGVSARSEGGRGGPLVLKRTETGSGRPLPDQALSNRALVNAASYDQRHLLVSERVGEGGPDDPEYRWLVFGMETGERATELRRDVSVAPFFLFDDSIVLVSQPHGYLRGEVMVRDPLKLEAFRLSNGVPKWNVELRDLSYQGQLPLSRRR